MASRRASAAEKRIDIVEDQIEDMPQTESGIEAVIADSAQNDVAQQDAVQQDEAEEVAARPDELRILEALLFASTEPLDQAALAKRMPDGINIKQALEQLQADYAMRGINLVRIANKWTFRTAGDLAWLMTRETSETKKLSRAAVEVLAIVAYHQPVTRAEIEDIRGVVTSKGTLDVLLETGWIKPRGRRKTPGRPLTFGTTDTFLSQFGLEALGDLPGLEELKGTGLLDSRLPAGFSVPNPSDDPQLREDEDPLEDGELHLALSAPDPEFPEAQGDISEAAAADDTSAQVVGFAETPAADESGADEIGDMIDAGEIGSLAVGDAEIDADGVEGADQAASNEPGTAEAETAELEAGAADGHDASDDVVDNAAGDNDDDQNDETPDADRDDDQHH
jgi:segregation and condensation protein B